MAEKTRSSIIGIKEETTEGTLIDLASGSEFTKINSGFSINSSVDSVSSEELVDGIGASESFTTKETPSASLAKDLKHSGVEGQAPDYAVMIKSAMGSQTDNATEYNTVSGSTAGSSTVAAVVNVDTGEGANFVEGQALLIKDGTNGYNVRNVKSISSDALTLNYNLPNAPGVGVNLGKANHWAPSPDGHPTYSVHHYQSSAATSSLHQAIAGCRTTSFNMNFPANELATIDFEVEGIKSFRNGITVSAANNKINFIDVSAGLELTATLSNKTYQSPKELASEVGTKMNAAGTNGDTISCTFDSTTGKYTISTTGAYLDIDWATGTDAANAADTILGFSADVTGATSYTGTESTYETSLTPAYDSSKSFVVKNQELVIGGFDRSDCRPANSFSLSVSTPKTDVDNFCSESGVSESVVLQREVTASATLVFQKHEIDGFNDLINNNTTSLMFNGGKKDSSGNWVPGTVINVSMPAAKITANTIADNDGFLVVEIEIAGFVASSDKDLHISML